MSMHSIEQKFSRSGLNHIIKFHIKFRKVDRFISNNKAKIIITKTEQKGNEGKYVWCMVHHAPGIKHKHLQIIDFAICHWCRTKTIETRTTNEERYSWAQHSELRPKGLFDRYKWRTTDRPIDTITTSKMNVMIY